MSRYEIEAKLLYWLTPESFKPLRLTPGSQKLRDRLLTLLVMMAVVLSLLYRRMDGLSEVVRVLEAEGLLWVDPFKVSKQVLSKRLTCLPTELFEQIFERVMVKIQSRADKLPIPIGWESAYQNFSALWIADSSTLEARSKKTQSFLRVYNGLGGVE